MGTPVLGLRHPLEVPRKHERAVFGTICVAQPLPLEKGDSRLRKEEALWSKLVGNAGSVQTLMLGYGSLRKADAALQVLKARIGTQGVEQGTSVPPHHNALRIGPFQKSEGLVLFSQSRID